MRDVGEMIWKKGAATPPKVTPLTSVKFVPAMTTSAPPAAVPPVLLRDVMVGRAPAGV